MTRATLGSRTYCESSLNPRGYIARAANDWQAGVLWERRIDCRTLTQIERGATRGFDSLCVPAVNAQPRGVSLRICPCEAGHSDTITHSALLGSPRYTN